MKKRVFLMVLDSAGIGEAPDAALFGDVGSDTFGSCARSGLLHVPTMEKMGLYKIDGISFGQDTAGVVGCYGKMQEQSMGKDTTVGHWEMAGVISAKPMPTYPDGFPQEVLDALEKATGRGILCNKVYSGTEVIKDYGQEQIATGKWIVYTSADSVLQIAAHEDVIPLAELYEACKIARQIMQGEHGVGRVIARPFTGDYPYVRTVGRHDYSLAPPRETILDVLQKQGLATIGVGKIYDIFAGQGIAETHPNEGNDENLKRTISILAEDFEGLCFVNLVDTDMNYGHRRDIPGYCIALNGADIRLGQFMKLMKPNDVLMITADHGCDPGFHGTDHTREYVPLLCYSPSFKQDVNLGIRKTFADIAMTIADYFEVDYAGAGESFLSEVYPDEK